MLTDHVHSLDIAMTGCWHLQLIFKALTTSSVSRSRHIFLHICESCTLHIYLCSAVKNSGIPMWMFIVCYSTMFIHTYIYLDIYPLKISTNIWLLAFYGHATPNPVKKIDGPHGPRAKRSNHNNNSILRRYSICYKR
jgi:hypothetical protein